MSAARANALNGADWLKSSFSIWRGIVRDGGGGHPAPFPVELANKLIDCFVSDRDGILLDPFAGSGSALIAALRCGMDAVGFDISSEYRVIFENRLSILERSGSWQYHTADARTLLTTVEPGTVEICVTSPPYWDILNRRRTADGKVARAYSADGNDIGNLADYRDFLDALGEVSSQVCAALRPRGYYVLNVMDIRKGPRFYPLHQDAATTVLRCSGFTFEDIIIWDRQADYNSMRPLGYPHKFIINKVHEYLLVFRKGEHG